MTSRKFSASCDVKGEFKTEVHDENSEESKLIATFQYDTPQPVGTIHIPASASLLNVLYNKETVTWELKRPNETTECVATALRLNKDSVQLRFGENNYIIEKGGYPHQFVIRKVPIVDINEVGKDEAWGEQVGRFDFEKDKWEYKIDCNGIVSIRLMLFSTWLINLVRLHSSGHAKLERLSLKNRIAGMKVRHAWMAADITILGFKVRF